MISTWVKKFRVLSVLTDLKMSTITEVQISVGIVHDIGKSSNFWKEFKEVTWKMGQGHKCQGWLYRKIAQIL